MPEKIETHRRRENTKRKMNDLNSQKGERRKDASRASMQNKDINNTLRGGGARGPLWASSLPPVCVSPSPCWFSALFSSLHY